MFALVDCNAFFCNCERLFAPGLRHRPVVVLSNNDGCVVSRTPEAKALNIKMGAPYFQVRDLCRKGKVTVFSSNFSLYTNLSDRVMRCLSQFTPQMEVYSVDEAFLDLSGQQDLDKLGHQIKHLVERWTGVPISVGIAPTKVLSKAAVHVAKRSPKAQGVVVLTEPHWQSVALERVPVEDIWGVGQASAAKWKILGVKNARQVRDYPNEAKVLRLFTKLGLALKHELMGISCFPLQTTTAKRQSIISSRTFGTPVTDKESLKQAVANYVSSAAERLREQGSVCAGLTVYARTNPFNASSPQYQAQQSHAALAATSDTRKLISWAMDLVDRIYRDGYAYKKAGVELSSIGDQAQLALFEKPDSPQSDRLMQVMDRINAEEGPLTLKSAACGVGNRRWRMNRDHKSPRYITSWKELPRVK